MTRHKTRLLVIGGLNLVVLVCITVFVATGNTGEDFFNILLGIEAVAGPALLDALGVERRRRTPSIPAIADDVREDSEESDR